MTRGRGGPVRAAEPGEADATLRLLRSLTEKLKAEGAAKPSPLVRGGNAVARLLERDGAACVIVAATADATDVTASFVAHVQKLARRRGVRAIVITRRGGTPPSLALGRAVGLKHALAVAVRKGGAAGGGRGGALEAMVQEMLSGRYSEARGRT